MKYDEEMSKNSNDQESLIHVKYSNIKRQSIDTLKLGIAKYLEIFKIGKTVERFHLDTL